MVVQQSESADQASSKPSKKAVVGVVEPRVVVKIPWSKFNGEEKKTEESQTSDHPGDQEEGEGETTTSVCRHHKKRHCHKHHHKKHHRHRSGDDGQRSNKKRRHSCKRKRSGEGDDESSKRTRDESHGGIKDDRIQHFRITETLPEHFKQALEGRTNGSLLLKKVEEEQKMTDDSQKSVCSGLNPPKLIPQQQQQPLVDLAADDEMSAMREGEDMSSFLRRRLPLLTATPLGRSSEEPPCTVSLKRLSRKEIKRHTKKKRNKRRRQQHCSFLRPHKDMKSFSDCHYHHWSGDGDGATLWWAGEG